MKDWQAEYESMKRSFERALIAIKEQRKLIDELIRKETNDECTVQHRKD